MRLVHLTSTAKGLWTSRRTSAVHLDFAACALDFAADGLQLNRMLHSARSLTSEFGIEHNGLILRRKGLTSPEKNRCHVFRWVFSSLMLFIVVILFLTQSCRRILACGLKHQEEEGRWWDRVVISNQTINFSEFQGEYKRVPTPQLPPRFDQRPVWEWGCPARGLIHSSECQWVHFFPS